VNADMKMESCKGSIGYKAKELRR